jgi:DNA (cytosine-5)-methyltransferase 1
LGLGFAGFRTLVCTDLAPAFIETVVGNLPGAIGYAADAMTLSGKFLCALARTTKIDLVAAGPPCQAFSILGRRGALDDPRGKLGLKYFDLVAEIEPRAFVFENVPGLLNTNDGADWARIRDYAAAVTGYHLHHAVLNAVTFGIPQFRERVFLVGFREDLPFRFPDCPTGPFADALMLSGQFATPSEWALEQVEGLPNHEVRLHGERVRRRYLQTAQGGRDSTDHTDRIHPQRPAGTVLVGSSAGGGRPHIHPYKPRVITVREGARLQSFPDWYVFHGTSTAQYRQVGNAVPPLLAYEVGKEIARTLRDSKARKQT